MRTSIISKTDNGFCEFCERVRATLRIEVDTYSNWTLLYVCQECIHNLMVDPSRIDITKKSK